MSTSGAMPRKRGSENVRDVSIYIPAYNAEAYLQRALEAVKKQTYPVAGVYVIDDGSTDATTDIAHRAGVVVIGRERNMGLGAARNLAFREIESEFIASLDADCEPEPDWLERLMRHFETDDIAGVGGKLLEKFQDRATDRWRAVHMKQHRGAGEIMNPEFLFGCNNVFRREAVLAVGNYSPAAEYRSNYEDAYISGKLYSHDYNLKYVPDAVVYHLRRDGLRSLYHASWRWFFNGKPKPVNMRNLAWQWKDSIYWALRYCRGDFRRREWRLTPISLGYAPFLMWWDLKYFFRSRMSRENQ